MCDVSILGLDVLKKKYPYEAIIFEDDTCPKCGEVLKIEDQSLGEKDVRVRYVCYNCGYICPIYHDTEANTIKPLYDRTVYNFIANFGKTIKDRMTELSKNKKIYFHFE